LQEVASFMIGEDGKALLID